MPIMLHNVLTRKKELFKPINDGQVGIYVCGVTVYGRCHVGHLRCYLSFDSILRYFKYRGLEVNYVRNFTDIDDKIIMRAREIDAGPDGEWRKGEAYSTYNESQWTERLDEDKRIEKRAAETDRHLAEVVSDHFIDVFRNEDFGPFDLLPPSEEPRVSENIPEVISLIQKNIDRGFAYENEGDVYFDVRAYHEATGNYGVLSGRDYTQLVEGARVAPTDKKRFGADFALWKKSNEGEPSWDSPFGSGRPGWHIECSAMSMSKLGETLDIHGGGKDLIFPHHENEIAQSEAATGKTYCNNWLHNGFVTVNSVKMSKSLGNFISIKDALEIAPPEVWRLLILSTHYAHPIDFSRTRSSGSDACETVRGTIDIAFDRTEYFYETLNRADELLADSEVPEDTPLIDDERVTGIAADFVKAMDDDFNTAKALADLGERMKVVNELCDMKAKKIKNLRGGRTSWLASIRSLASELKETFAVLGLLRQEPAVALKDFRNFCLTCKCLNEKEIQKRIDERIQARKDKDWARSDELRDELLALGVELRDCADGTQWKVLR